MFVNGVKSVYIARGKRECILCQCKSVHKRQGEDVYNITMKGGYIHRQGEGRMYT